QPDKWQRIQHLYERANSLDLVQTNTRVSLVQQHDISSHQSHQASLRSKQASAEIKTKSARAALPGGTPLAPKATAVENDELPPPANSQQAFHDFGFGTSEMPADDFGWKRLEARLDNTQRVQSKLRERQLIINK